MENEFHVKSSEDLLRCPNYRFDRCIDFQYASARLKVSFSESIEIFWDYVHRFKPASFAKQETMALNLLLRPPLLIVFQHVRVDQKRSW